MSGLIWVGLGYLLGDKEARDKTISLLKKATRVIDEKVNESIGYTKPSEPDTKLCSVKQRQTVEETDRG